MPSGSDVSLGNIMLDTLVSVTGVTYPTLAANASSSNTLTVPGVQVGDFLSVNLAAPVTHLELSSGYVSAANTVTLWWNTDATGVTGASTAQILINVARSSRPTSLLPNNLSY